MTLLAARDRAADAFARAGIAEAREDATALLCHAAAINRAGLIARGDTPLSHAQTAAFRTAVERRLAREPVTRIVTSRGFWDMELAVAPGVLDPRADSETLVSAALELAAARKYESLRIVDLGCGSGALICALLREFPAARGFAIDLSPAACALTLQNAVANGVANRLTIQNRGWGADLPGPFDIAVSNPPYIPTGDLEALDPEVRLHDPVLALDGGEDGLTCYRELARLAPGMIAPGGLFVAETGYDQAESVSALFRAAGLTSIQTFRDLAGYGRVVAGRSPQANYR